MTTAQDSLRLPLAHLLQVTRDAGSSVSGDVWGSPSGGTCLVVGCSDAAAGPMHGYRQATTIPEIAHDPEASWDPQALTRPPVRMGMGAACFSHFRSSHPSRFLASVGEKSIQNSDI